MSSRAATTFPGSVSVLAAFCAALVPCLGEPLWPDCDNGKVFLEQDLPNDPTLWGCPTSLWPKPQRLYSVDTVYDPEPANFTCMDKHISYNHTIPNSGAFRPVAAESGEYLYCPPQRWLRNLHRGGTVLLYHPCSPLDERLLLSSLAQSCIRDYILTPHRNLDKKRPFALVSWSRTLEVSGVASSEICDWLDATSSGKTDAGDLAQKPLYNLFLTRSTAQNKHKLEGGSVKQCCEQAVSSQTKEAKMSQLRSELQMKQRGKRAATEGTINLPKLSSKQTGKVLLELQSNETISSQNSATQSGAKGTRSESINPKENTQNIVNISGNTTNNIPLIHPRARLQKAGSDKVQNNHRVVNATVRRKSLKPVAERRGGAPEAAADSTDIEAVDGSDSQPRGSVSSDGGACQCGAGRPCECGNGAGDQIRQFQRTPRTDEAVWAAGALAFLLALLTLSILHTRLYKHWRRGTSLYWHDPRQDYDRVADVIRRRLRLTKKKRNRSRRKEYVLLPSSSSSEEYP